MKYKVLFLICDKQFGGGSRHLFDLISSLDKKKFEPVLICDNPKLSDKLSGSIRTYNINAKNILDNNAIAKIEEILKEENPAIMHLHSTKGMILGIKANKKLSIPVIYTEHLFAKNYLPKNRLIHYLQLITLKKISNKVDKIIAVSNAVKNYLVDKNVFPSDKIEVIHNGILIPQKTNNVKDENEIKIGSIGTLNKLKGFEYLISAMKFIKNDIKLEIVGDGPEKNDLINLTKKLNLFKRISFIYKTENINKLLSSWQIYCQPSLSETFGLALTEAMANRLAVVASDVGGIPEIIGESGKYGILVNVKKPEEIAESINRLLNNPELRIKMGLKASKRIQNNFSLNLMINRTEKLYEKIIKAGA